MKNEQRTGNLSQEEIDKIFAEAKDDVQTYQAKTGLRRKLFVRKMVRKYAYTRIKDLEPGFFEKFVQLSVKESNDGRANDR